MSAVAASSAAGPSAVGTGPPRVLAPKDRRHPGIPDRGYIICHWCLNWATREENEISKHYRKGFHKEVTPQFAEEGATPYHLCRIVPSRVAAALVLDAQGDQAKLALASTDFKKVQHKTKAKPATHAEMAEMFRLRGLPVPAWLPGIRLVRIPGWMGEGDENEDMDEDDDDEEVEDDDEEDDDEDMGGVADDDEAKYGSPDDVILE